MIYGVGTDLVDVARVEKILERWKAQFIKRVYSEGEITYCNAMGFPAQHFAVRFAAKEAFLKGIGLGMSGGISFRDVEVIKGDEGNPRLGFHGKAVELMNKAGIKRSHLSLSHTGNHAIAFVVLEN